MSRWSGYAGASGIISHFPEGNITVTLLSNMEDGVWDPAWKKIHKLVLDGQLTWPSR